MIAVLDHQDSFTHNLVHLLHEIGPVGVFNLNEIEKLDASTTRALVLSPGPGCPEDYPASTALYRKVRGKLPVLGVCLGFQLILHAEGGQIRRQHKVLHGVRTPICIDPECRTYAGIDPDLKIGRYHSLQIDGDSLPAHIHVTGWDTEEPVPLSFEIPGLDIFGFQYHPDSFLTDHGRQILINCLRGSVEP